MKILIFIPMYNCEKQISRVISQFDEDTQKLFDEILIVDNISEDNSLKAAEESLKKLNNIKTTLIQNKENVSLGGSHKVAFNYAIENNYDYIIVLHGDDQGSIKDIVSYIKDKTAFQYDAFLGARFMKGSETYGYSKFRIFGNYAVNIFISIFLRNNISDMGSGLNLFSVDILQDKFYMPFKNDLTFNVYLLFYFIYKKINFKFFPLTWREDDQISNAKVFKQGVHIIKMTIKYIFNADKLLNKENSDNNLNYKIVFKK